MPFVLLYLVVEIVALVAVASWIGIGWTIVALLAGTVVGTWLARREGVRAVTAINAALRERRLAHSETTDGLLIAVGGLLILLPGFVSDLAGLLLVLPPTRALLRRRLIRAAERQAPGLRTARIRSESPVVDGEIVPEPRHQPDRPGQVIEGTVVDPGDRR